MDYTCSANNATAEFSSVAPTFSHSAWNSTENCSLTQCQTSTHDCRSSQTHCFDYRTVNNISYCAPASDCFILEACNGTCSSNLFVCVINTCCRPKARCLPLFLTTLCPSSSKTNMIQRLYVT